TDEREGVYLCSPSGNLVGGQSKDDISQALITGLTTLIQGAPYLAKYIHFSGSRILFLNDRIDQIEWQCTTRVPYATAGSTLIPMRDETGTLLATPGMIGKMIMKDRRHGIQQFRGYDATNILVWFTFDRADFDRNLGIYGKFLDKSANLDHLEQDVGTDPGDMVEGAINEALKVVGGNRWSVDNLNGTVNAEPGMTFLIRFDDSIASETGDCDYIEVLDDSAVTVIKIWYDNIAGTLKVYYVSGNHASIPLSVVDDSKFHLFNINQEMVYVDDNAYTVSEKSSSGGDYIKTMYIGSANVDGDFTIDELVIVDQGIDDNYQYIDYMQPSWSDIPMLLEKHHKADFSKWTRNRYIDWNDADVQVRFNGAATDSITLSRRATDGDCNGTLYVVDCDASEWTVQHKEIDVTTGSATTQNSSAFTAVVAADTFLLHTYETSEAQPHMRDGAWVADLNSTTTARVQRTVAGSPSATSTHSIAVVECNNNEWDVQRNAALTLDATTKTDTITGIDQTRSFISVLNHHSQPFSVGRNNSTTGSEIDDTQCAANFSADDTVQFRKKNTTIANDIISYEVVQFATANITASGTPSIPS
ncbi:hypothetical protein LCGC14_2275000, partial [marine sediment metagenome]